MTSVKISSGCLGSGNRFQTCPLLCLTATANEQVRMDVLSTLGVDKIPGRLKTFTMTANRPNLHLEIRFTRDDAMNDKYDDFVTWLKGVYARRESAERRAELDVSQERVDNVPGIIYTFRGTSAKPWRSR